MKILVSEATTDQLDYMVAKIEGEVSDLDDFCLRVEAEYSYSTNWAYGGPIIERERITVSALYAQKNPPTPEYAHGEWGAYIPCGCSSEAAGRGSTPLIAAMRCYVASKLGEEVDVPEELTCTQS